MSCRTAACDGAVARLHRSHRHGFKVMSDYRLIAQRCVQLAIRAKEQSNRTALLDLAGEWLELADSHPKTAALIAQVEALKQPEN